MASLLFVMKQKSLNLFESERSHFSSFLVCKKSWNLFESERSRFFPLSFTEFNLRPLCNPLLQNPSFTETPFPNQTKRIQMSNKPDEKTQSSTPPEAKKKIIPSKPSKPPSSNIIVDKDVSELLCGGTRLVHEPQLNGNWFKRMKMKRSLIEKHRLETAREEKAKKISNIICRIQTIMESCTCFYLSVPSSTGKIIHDDIWVITRSNEVYRQLATIEQYRQQYRQLEEPPAATFEFSKQEWTTSLVDDAIDQMIDICPDFFCEKITINDEIILHVSFTGFYDKLADKEISLICKSAVCNAPNCLGK